jgi:hypothetical protein
MKLVHLVGFIRKRFGNLFEVNNFSQSFTLVLFIWKGLLNLHLL